MSPTRRWMRDDELYPRGGTAVEEPTHTWFVPDGGTEAHAQPIGPGWLRSACREVRWTVKARQVTNADARCSDCVTVTREGQA